MPVWFGYLIVLWGLLCILIGGLMLSLLTWSGEHLLGPVTAASIAIGVGVASLVAVRSHLPPSPIVGIGQAGVLTLVGILCSSAVVVPSVVPGKAGYVVSAVCIGAVAAIAVAVHIAQRRRAGRRV